MVCVLIEDSAAFIYMHLLIGPHEALWERALLVSNFNRTEVKRRLEKTHWRPGHAAWVAERGLECRLPAQEPLAQLPWLALAPWSASFPGEEATEAAHEVVAAPCRGASPGGQPHPPEASREPGQGSCSLGPGQCCRLAAGAGRGRGVGSGLAA